MLALAFLAAALTFGEHPVSDLTLRTLSIYQRDIAIASNGRNSVVVFSAQRNQKWSLFRAVIDNDGNVVDSRLLAAGLGLQYVTLASDGERFLAALQHGGALLLDANGNLLRRLPSGNGQAAASNGATFLVSTYNGVQLLDRDGNPIGGSIAFGTNETAVALGAAGSRYIVATTLSSHLYVRTLAAGVLSPPTDLGDAPSDVRIASSGDEALVASLQNYSVQALVFRSDGTYTTPVHWLAVSTNTLSAAWNGSDYAVAFSINGGTVAARVGRDGSIVAEPRTITSDSGVLAWNGARYVFAGENGEQLFDRAFAAVTVPRSYADYAAEQLKPHIATDGTSMLVTWIDGPSTLRATRVAPDGTSLDGAGLVVTSALADDVSAVAFDGRDWIVAYPAQWYRIGVRRISRDGRVSGETSIAASSQYGTTPGNLRLAATPTGRYAVICDVSASSSSAGATIVASIDGAAPQQLSTTQRESLPDIAWNGHVFRVAWIDSQWFRSSPPGYVHDYLQAVGVSIATLSLNGTLTVDAKIAADLPEVPRIAGDLVVWPQLGRQLGIWRGAALTAFPRSDTGDSYDPPALAADDAGRALLVWSGVSALFVPHDAGDAPSVFALPARGVNPDVAWTDNGFVVVYARSLAEPPYNGGSRVFIQSVPLPPRQRAVR